MKWDGKNINIERAEEPTDYYWEHLSIKSKTRIKRVVFTYLISFFCLLVALVIYIVVYDQVLSIFNLQTNGYTEDKNQDISRVALFINSLLILLVNSVLCKIGKVLSKQEKHETLSKYHASVALKLTIVMFINSLVIPILLQSLEFNDNFFENMSNQMYSLIINMCFVDPLLQIFDVFWICKRVRRIREKRKGVKSNLSQREANELFEGDEFVISERYAKTMLLTLIV
jgi:hypothetical protein